MVWAKPARPHKAGQAGQGGTPAGHRRDTGGTPAGHLRDTCDACATILVSKMADVLKIEKNFENQ